MTDGCEVVIVGSGFAGSLLARVLARQGYDVALIERGRHPRFAIGESSTPLANLSLERLARRYGLHDCWHLAAHGRWTARYPGLRRGLKRGFTFYRHHPHAAFADRGLDSERLLVAASPEARVADTHWLRADVDHHFVREAVAAGVLYHEGTDLALAEPSGQGWRLGGTSDGRPFELRANFLVDATGPGGFLARQLGIPSALERTSTRSGLLFSHFTGVGLMGDAVPGLPVGPYPDDWAAVHHIVDGGWVYSLRFDDGATSAGLLLSEHGRAALDPSRDGDPAYLWRALLDRYPTLARLFGAAEPTRPLWFQPRVQHRLARAAGERWALLPHAYAFFDPLFSTSIAWSLRAVERLGLAFERATRARRLPDPGDLARYDDLLGAEADQLDALLAGAYDAMAHFELFAAHAMIYFAVVSFAETRQRIASHDAIAWEGLLGVDDLAAQPLPGESRRRLAALAHDETGRCVATPADRRAFEAWVREAIAPRNVAGLADRARHNLYPVDLETLVQQHAKLGLTRERLLEALPLLRGVDTYAVPGGSSDDLRQETKPITAPASASAAPNSPVT